jgi:hypothetical protein
VSATSLTVGTARQTSTNVSADGALVAGSISLMFGGSVNVILAAARTRTFRLAVGLSDLRQRRYTGRAGADQDR